jgi:hypothetical protein
VALGRCGGQSSGDRYGSPLQLRPPVSAGNAPQSWDFRCKIREKPIAHIRDDMPEALPHECVFGKRGAGLHLATLSIPASAFILVNKAADKSGTTKSGS